MSAPETLSRIRQVVSTELSIDPARVTEASTFADDLGADSLDTIKLVMAFEEAFDLDIPDDAAEKIVTVKDAVSYIESHGKP